MFDIGWTEILILAVVSLFVIGPKDIPKFLGYIGRLIGKIRGITSDFRETVDDAIKNSELEEVRKEISFTDPELSKNFNEILNPVNKGTQNKSESGDDDNNSKKEDLNSNLQLKEIVDGEFKLVRSSNSTDLFYNSSSATVLVKSDGKIYNKLHKRLLDEPNTDIRIGYFWDKNKKKPKSYMFQYKKPDQIFARLDGYIREIYIKDNSINTITDDFQKYLYVSIKDHNQGAWVAARTEKSGD